MTNQYTIDTKRPYVKLCTDCGEWCDFEDKSIAKELADNHDGNFHDGEPSVVLYSADILQSEGNE